MRWGRVAAGALVIVLVAVPCLVAVIAMAVLGNHYQRSNPAATGRAPGVITFQSQDTHYVIALSDRPDGILDGLTRSERRAKSRVYPGEAAAARCTITHPDGSTDAVRGDRQVSGTSVANVYESVGAFDGQLGETTVSCTFDPADDLLGNATEAPLMIHESSGWLRYGLFALLGALALAAGAGVLLILSGTVWRGQVPPGA